MKQTLIFSSILVVILTSCGQPSIKNENQNLQTVIAEQTKISGLKKTLQRLKKGELEYDFFGLTSNGTDCLYFVYENNGFNIEFEVMAESQKQYFQQLKKYCIENNIKVVETTYQNQPQYSDTKFAPVLRLEINATLNQTDKLGQTLMDKIFKNGSNTKYDIVP